MTKPERRAAGSGGSGLAARAPQPAAVLSPRAPQPAVVLGAEAFDASGAASARPWRQRAALPLGLLLLTALGGGVVWLRLQLAIERCADAGGKWASLDRRCTFAEPIEPEPMLARPAGTTVKSPSQ